LKREEITILSLVIWIKYFTPLSLTKIIQLFEMDYSAISQSDKRFDQRRKVNLEIEKIKQKMMAALKEH